MFSFVGDIILDPFSGSGSTIISALDNKRIGIGIEVDQNYCELSKKRILASTLAYQETLSLSENEIEEE